MIWRHGMLNVSSALSKFFVSAWLLDMYNTVINLINLFPLFSLVHEWIIYNFPGANLLSEFHWDYNIDK